MAILLRKVALIDAGLVLGLGVTTKQPKKATPMKTPITSLECRAYCPREAVLSNTARAGGRGRALINQALLIALALFAGSALARATSGTWTNDASSVWSATANWLNGTVADGTDAAADFSTLDITADRTVTLDSARNIGSLLFGDVSGSQNWFLNASGGNILTLAGSFPAPPHARH